MTNLHDNALMLLHFMFDKGIIMPKSISPRELRAAVGLSDQDFDDAENFILQSGFVEGGGGGLDSIRWLTPPGVHYIKDELKQRIPIKLDAERVLRFLIEEIKDKPFLAQNDILKGVNIPLDHSSQVKAFLVLSRTFFYIIWFSKQTFSLFFYSFSDSLPFQQGKNL